MTIKDCRILKCLIHAGAPKEAINLARMRCLCSNATTAFTILNNFIKSINENYTIVLVGELETLDGDLDICNDNYEPESAHTFFNSLNTLPNFKYHECVKTLNKAIPAFADPPHNSAALLENSTYGRHTVRYIDTSRKTILSHLNNCGFGVPVTFNGTNITVKAYTTDTSITSLWWNTHYWTDWSGIMSGWIEEISNNIPTPDFIGLANWENNMDMSDWQANFGASYGSVYYEGAKAGGTGFTPTGLTTLNAVDNMYTETSS